MKIRGKDAMKIQSAAQALRAYGATVYEVENGLDVWITSGFGPSCLHIAEILDAQDEASGHVDKEEVEQTLEQLRGGRERITKYFGTPDEPLVLEHVNSDGGSAFIPIHDEGDAAKAIAAAFAKNPAFVAAFLDALAAEVHQSNVDAGWWTDLKTGESILHTRNVPEMLMLVVSELGEAMEAYRKNLMDDKLPHRPGLITECIDAAIRILDIAGSRMRIEAEAGVEVHGFGTVFQEKRDFNRTREDHKLENRRLGTGKQF